MLTIYPGTPTALPVTGGDFPIDDIPGQSSSGEIWDLLYLPNGGSPDFAHGGNPMSNNVPVGASVVYDPGSNTLTVTMPTLATIRAADASYATVNYGLWEIVYDTQPGSTHVASAGRSAYFQFAAAPAPISTPTLTATPTLASGTPEIVLVGSGF